MDDLKERTGMKSFGQVLIVDDSSTSRMIIQRCMQMAGIEVATYVFAENGLDAYAVLRGNKAIELVITDINMPKMDGRTFATLLRGDTAFAGLPIIIVSSIADSALESELLALGVKSVVKKPVSPAKMLQAVGGES
jgi:two-component system, chemotaxis family, chemotaxis protein CheY